MAKWDGAKWDGPLFLHQVLPGFHPLPCGGIGQVLQFKVSVLPADACQQAISFIIVSGVADVGYKKIRQGSAKSWSQEATNAGEDPSS